MAKTLRRYKSITLQARYVLSGWYSPTNPDRNRDRLAHTHMRRFLHLHHVSRALAKHESENPDLCFVSDPSAGFWGDIAEQDLAHAIGFASKGWLI